MQLGRVAEISKVFIEEGLGLAATEDEPDSPVPGADEQRARRLRRALERLGPTFIKFGQILATRVDLFGPEFLRELGKLRSHVPPFSAAEARACVEQQLQRPLDEVFVEFPEHPAASASIAQVYRAQLRDDDTWVAVKVQRPRLQETLASDLAVLIEVSRFVDRLVPAYHRSLVHRVAVEYAARARQEIDFLAEANAMARFQEVLATLPEFRVPRVRLDLCGERLLVMEWLEGPLLDEVEDPKRLRELGVEPRSLASAMLRLQLGMSYEHGFVHGDTHPGNIILLSDGRLGLIDFGLHGVVPRRLCDRMLELLFYQCWGRTDEAVGAFVQIFSPDPELDLEEFARELRGVLEQGAARSARESRLTAQLVEGLRLGARYRLQAQSDLFVVIRNLTIVEGIVLTYCPEMDLIGEVRQILGNILQRRAFGTLMGGELKQLLPLALLTLSQRPLLLDRLLRVERSFIDAHSLGEFLRREGVLESPKSASSAPIWIPLLLGLLVGIGGSVVVGWLFY
jgi:ubiquinone biosynthesis protein